MKLNFEIREFTIRDYGDVARIWDLVDVASPEGRKEAEKRLQRDPELFLVADMNSSVIGVVMGSWDGRRAWCHNYGVDPKFRGMGVGSALIKEVLNRLRGKGVRRANALVRKEDAGAQGFYEASGFYKEDWVVMEYDLS